MSFYELFGYAIIALCAVTVPLIAVIAVMAWRKLRDARRAAAVQDFQDALDQLARDIGGAKNTIGEALAPQVTEFAEQVSVWIEANQDLVANDSCASEADRREP